MGENASGETKSPGAGKRRWRNARPLADLATGVLAPIVARRAGMSIDLLAAWPDVVGPDYGDRTRPERIKWPRKASQSAEFEPGTLVLAVDPRVALQIQHETGQVLERVNLFFGFQAVDRLQIRQRPVESARRAERSLPPDLAAASRRRLEKILTTIADPALRRSLEQWGKGVFAKATARRRGKGDKDGD